MPYLAPCPPKINRRVSCRLHVKINQIYHWGEGANWEHVQSQNAFSSVKEAQSRAWVAPNWPDPFTRQYCDLKKQRHYYADKGLSSHSYGFFSSSVWMWELDYKESWVLKNWWFWTVVLEKTLESPLGCKEIQPIHPKGDQFWIFFGRTAAEAEAPILWPPDVKSWLIGKDPDAGKDWRWEEKGKTEDEMVGWHHWLNGHEFEQALGVGDGQGSLACCSPWGHKELYVTEWLN